MQSDEQKIDAQLFMRSGIGGILMGLANLVPGISGGTMLLAAGIYPDFINSIAEVSTLKLRRYSLAVLGSVVCFAALGILLLAGPVKNLVVDYRWIMYSLFIGLTLGGVPLIARMSRPFTRSSWIGALSGFLLMAALAFSQQAGLGTGGGAFSGWLMLFVAGVAGASAMILPGVSGGYLLLVLGQYVIILSGIDSLKEGLKVLDWPLIMNVMVEMVIPVGLGVVIGVVLVSNLLKLCMDRYEKTTLGVLLGLLLGAVVGLWPFVEGVAPEIGSLLKGQVVTPEMIIDPQDFPLQYFKPALWQVCASLGLILGGFMLTMGIARLGRKEG